MRSFSAFFIIIFLFSAIYIATINNPAYAIGRGQVGEYHKAIAIHNRWLNIARAPRPSDLTNRIILLNFWAYSRASAMQVVPELDYLKDKFKDKLTIISVHAAKFKNEKNSDNIRNALMKIGIKHAVVNDALFRVWQSFNVNNWPTLILIDPAGNIVKTYNSVGGTDKVEEEIDRLIKKHRNVRTDPLPTYLERYNAPEYVLRYPGKITYVEDIGGKPALFISDSGHNRILAVRPDTGKVFITIGSGHIGKYDGNLKKSQFYNPQGTLYRDGILYVADANNHLIRKVDLLNNRVTSIAGTGNRGDIVRLIKDAKAVKYPLTTPWDLAFYPTKNEITIAMMGTNQLWTYDITEKTMRILAGSGTREFIDDGVYPENSLSEPSALAVHKGKLYFTDSDTSSLRVFENGSIYTLIGKGLFDFGFKDGNIWYGLMQHPLGLFVDDDGAYIADTYNHSIRKFSHKFQKIGKFSGKGKRGMETETIRNARYNEPSDIIKVGDLFYVADTNNHLIRVIDTKDNKVGFLKIFPMKMEEILEPVSILYNVKRLDLSSNFPPGEGNKFKLQLSKGWKINKKMPNWAIVFQVNAREDSEVSIVKTYSQEEILNGELNLSLLSSVDYRLQGTFYFCEDKKEGRCLVQSVDEKFATKRDFVDSDEKIITEIELKTDY